MERTIYFAKQAGYSDGQAEIIGKIHALFEKAVSMDMCTQVDVTLMDAYCGQIFGTHTGLMEKHLINNSYIRRE